MQDFYYDAYSYFFDDMGTKDSESGPRTSKFLHISRSEVLQLFDSIKDAMLPYADSLDELKGTFIARYTYFLHDSPRSEFIKDWKLFCDCYKEFVNADHIDLPEGITIKSHTKARKITISLDSEPENNNIEEVKPEELEPVEMESVRYPTPEPAPKEQTMRKRRVSDRECEQMREGLPFKHTYRLNEKVRFLHNNTIKTGKVVEVCDQSLRISVRNKVFDKDHLSCLPFQSVDEDRLVVIGGTTLMNPFPKELNKFWFKRYFFFKRWDFGIQVDKTGMYSVTAEDCAVCVSRICRVIGYNRAIDCFAGSGQNSIQFALMKMKTVGVELDFLRYKCAVHNAKIYEAKCQLRWGNTFEIVPTLKINSKTIMHIAPPWGGVGYSRVDFTLNDFDCDIEPLMDIAFENGAGVLLQVPRSFTLEGYPIPDGYTLKEQIFFLESKVYVKYFWILPVKKMKKAQIRTEQLQCPTKDDIDVLNAVLQFEGVESDTTCALL
ncbi:hypothetical protein PCE1_004825 [Barthelona sp. PCE]